VIPRVIHQIWLGESGGPQPFPRFREAAATWRAQHPGWQYRLWDGAEVDQLFASARPDLHALYRAYPHWVQRADAARYLILHEHGGVYADLDIQCVGSFDTVADADLLLAPTAPFGLSNDLMAATPGHPLFTCVVDELATSHRLWGRPWVPRHFQIMCGTGSLFLSRVFARLDAGTSVRLLTSGEYGHGSADEALVHHIEGNSWAGWDTKALVFLQDRWPFLMVGTLILIAVLASP